MMNLKNILSASALAVALTATGTVAYAQQAASPEQTQQERIGKRGGHRGKGFRHGRRGGADRLFSQLNLTDAQKEQLKQIRERYSESTKSLREEMRASRRNLKEGAQDGTFNESAVRAAAQASNNARVELAVARAKMRSEIFAVLTAEQKTQLEQLKEQRRQRREEFRQKRQEMKAQRQAAKQAE